MPTICPDCASESINIIDHGLFECMDCGHQWDTSSRICPNCGHINAPDSENCTECGESLDVVKRLLSRHPTGSEPGWLEQARSRAADLKQMEEISSQQRLETFKEIDRKRDEVLREMQRQQRQKEQRTLTATLWLLGAMLVIIVVATLVIILRG